MSSPPAYTLMPAHGSSSPPPYHSSPLVRYYAASSPASQVSSSSEASSAPSEVSSGSDVSVNPTTPDGATFYCTVSDTESEAPSTPLASSSSVQEESEYESDGAATPTRSGWNARSMPANRIPAGQRFQNLLRDPAAASRPREMGYDASSTLRDQVIAPSLRHSEDVDVDMSSASSLASEVPEDHEPSMTEGVVTQDGWPVREAIDELLTANGTRLLPDRGEDHYPAESYQRFVDAWHAGDARRARKTLQTTPLGRAEFDQARLLVAEAEYDLARYVDGLVNGMNVYFGTILMQRQEALDSATAEVARLTKTIEVASHSFHAVVTENHDLQAQLAAESAKRRLLEDMLASFRDTMEVAMARGLKRPLEQTLAP